MSWSRVVKHRRDQREHEKKTGSKSKKEKYMYPELDSSSDDSCYCFSSPENGEVHSYDRSSTESEGDDKEYSRKDGNSKSKLNHHSRTSEQVKYTNGHHEQVHTVNLPPRFEDMPITAPLAVPEDSDGSSQNSGCDFKEKETDVGSDQNQLSDTNHGNKTSDVEQGIIGIGMLEIEKEVENVFTHVSSSESLEEIADEENSSEIPLNRGGLV